MKDRICEPNPKVAVSCRPTLRPLAASLHRKVASTTSQREIPRRIYVIYFFALNAMEPDYFRSFKQSRRLSIFVVHEIQLQPRCIMESVNGSLRCGVLLHARPLQA